MIDTFFRSRETYHPFVAAAFCLIGIRLSFSAAVPKNSSITCDVPSVEPLAKTSITCHFPEDVNVTKRGFSISLKESPYHYERKVLSGSWSFGDWSYSIRDGYKLIMRMSHKVTLEIPRASVEHVGRYACQLTNMDPEAVKPCEFKLTLVGKTICSMPSVKKNLPTSLTCYVPQDLRKTRAEFAVYHFSNSGVIDTVLSCTWIEEDHLCTIDSDYIFEGVMTDHFSLMTFRASEVHEGTYRCQIKGDSSLHYKSCSFVLEKETTSTCHIPSVQEMEPATLTCRFSVDISVTKRNFKVVHLPHEHNKNNDILGCFWSNVELFCYTAPGYVFVNTVSDHFVIRIPRASHEHSGIYSCQDMGSEIEGFQPCQFIIEKGFFTSTYSTVIFITTKLLIMLAVFTACLIIRRARRNSSLHWETEKLLESEERQEGDHKTPLNSENEGYSSKFFLETVRDSQARSTVSEGELKKPDGCKQSDTDQSHLKIIGRTAEAQRFWLQWVEAAFPDLDSRAYFLPPVYFNRVPITRRAVAGQDVLVLQSAPGQAVSVVQLGRRPAPLQVSILRINESDIRYDAAMQRVLFCLQDMFEQNREVLVGLSSLPFKAYLGDTFQDTATAQVPRFSNLPFALPPSWKHGKCDVLLIDRGFGLIVFQVESFGDNIKMLNMSQHEIDKTIRKKLNYSILQLEKKKAMLSHLVSDIAPGLHITKAIAFPNLTARQIHHALCGDIQLIQYLCQCLETTTDPADITSLCLCCDQLSDPKTPWDVTSHVLRELGHWWQRRVAGAGPDPHMTPGVYRTLVARFCAPAATVSVPSTCPPRLSVKTLGQAVWCTGECYTALIALFPEHIDLLHTAFSRLFMAGPPGTGKTVVLLLMAIQWLRCGHHVYIVSTWQASLAACIMLYHLLLQTVKTEQSTGVSPGQPHLLQCDFYRTQGEDVQKAVNDLLQAAQEGSLYVIADEAGPELRPEFQIFCEKLLREIPRLHLWAASCYHGHAPAGWQEKHLTRPIRCPPAVVREVEQAWEITDGIVHPYSERGVPDHTDGPPVRRLYHRGQGHSGDWPGDCVTCGREVASFLHSLRVGVTENVTRESMTSPHLQWRDIVVLCWTDISHNLGLVDGLQEAGIPVRVMKDDDIEDVATARSDVVWVIYGDRVRGLERKIVVCLEPDVISGVPITDLSSVRLHLMSRCTAQLLIVSL